MKKELLSYIKCPVCAETSFIAESISENNGVISGGRLVCAKCESGYKISKGIPFLYQKLNQAAAKEKEANEREMLECREQMSFRDENWLLNFPDVSKMGVNERNERVIRLINENTDLSLKKYLDVKNASILEIGAGNCWATAKLAKNNYCIALDILTMPPYGLETGEVFISKRGVYFERVSADMDSLPFRDGVFDYVLISSSLHHSYQPEKTLKEISRVLKSGGQFVLLNEPSRGWFGSKERQQTKIDLANNVNEQRYTINEWLAYFSGSGFDVEIFLPENLLDAVRSRGGIYRFANIPLKIGFLRELLEKFSPKIILFIFDGYFNSFLIKNSKKASDDLAT